MFVRGALSTVVDALGHFPVVGLVGPRQVGKTTLARSIGDTLGREMVYIDLERASGLAKLEDAETYLVSHARDLVVLDEIQRMPELFPLLRSLVDDEDRAGRFLILGSATPDLMARSSETLAGRIRFVELTPFRLDEIPAGGAGFGKLWNRGGFPRSYLAPDDARSFDWREAFVETYLARDLPAFGVRVSPSLLRRFWQIVAHHHGAFWNASAIASTLGVSSHTVRHYLDILADTYMVRILPSFQANLKKRLVKTPKIYVRDSGLLHALLGLRNREALVDHPAFGHSFEGFVIEQILATLPRSWSASFLRTSAGAEIDLVLEPPGGGPPTLVEIKASSDPTLQRGFWSAKADLPGARGYVVAPVSESFPLGQGVVTVPVTEISNWVSKLA